ncbi:MAG: ABC transporter substrate-binding protein, partial [Rhodococcus sp. (in: high G+C Gram-positive bacteria)]
MDRTVSHSICLDPAPDSTALDTDEQWSLIVDALTRRGFLGAGLGVAAATLLAACSSDENGVESGGFVTVQDETGSVEIPSDPQRMVIAHVSAMATVLDLGVPPEKIVGGFFGLEGVSGDAVLRTMPEAANIPNLGTAGTWNKEAVIGASPDLIVMLLTAGNAVLLPPYPSPAAIP